MKKRLLSIGLALALALSLVPVGIAATIPETSTYYEKNPYTNAKLIDQQPDGEYHYQLTIAADGARQCVPLFLCHVYPNVTSSDTNVVGVVIHTSCNGFYGKAPGTATVTLSLRAYDSDTPERKAVIDVTVLSEEDFASYTGNDATRSVKGHEHSYTIVESPELKFHEMLRREVCTECGDWSNLRSDPLPSDYGSGTEGKNSTSTNPTPDPTVSASPNPNPVTSASPVPTDDPTKIIPGINSPSSVDKTTQNAPAVSSNINQQNYDNNTSDTVKSYLYANEKGGLTRVECIETGTGSGKVIVEEYSSSFELQSAWSTKLELPTWGGFYAGKNYNFMVFGQYNGDESDNVEVIRVVKYSKDWSQRLGQASLYGGNTVSPFGGGSLRFAEDGDNLCVRTCHVMYETSDGINHQANMMLNIRQSDMAIVNAFYQIANENNGYVSHSRDTFLLVDRSNKLVTLDHGDHNPRGLMVARWNQIAGHTEPGAWWGNSLEISKPLTIAENGHNATGCTVGGFAETSSGYVAAYSYNGTGQEQGSHDLYLSITNKEGLKSSSIKVSSGMNVSTPQLASNGLSGGYVLWNQRNAGRYDFYDTFGDTLYYAPYDANGRAGAIKTATAALSDCVPIQHNGKFVWYVTDNSAPTFYTLDASGVTAHPVGAITYDSVAYANTQTVLLDGKPVTFQTYALKDNYGGLTNYIKLRDMAYYLNGTKAQFAVSWNPDNGAVAMRPGSAYTPNGSELKTPFSGDRAYRDGAGYAVFGSTRYSVSSIVLTDDNGGDYTYFKLRDLGYRLEFNVSYINGQVVINTNEPYSDAQ